MKRNNNKLKEYIRKDVYLNSKKINSFLVDVKDYLEHPVLSTAERVNIKRINNLLELLDEWEINHISLIQKYLYLEDAYNSLRKKYEKLESDSVMDELNYIHKMHELDKKIKENE